MQQELFRNIKTPNKGKALKAFMQNHFDFSALKKAGVFPKEMKFNDYDAQAKRICEMFSLENIYDYGKHEIRCHISYAGDRPIRVDENGKMQTNPFVEVIFPNQMHI